MNAKLPSGLYDPSSEFYEAFYEYNQMAEKPLYLFHGVWVNEEIFLKTKDAFARKTPKNSRMKSNARSI